MRNKVQVCIIGAGPSGIAAAKNAIQYGFEVVVFEKMIKSVATGSSMQAQDTQVYMRIPTSSVRKPGQNMKIFPCLITTQTTRITFNYRPILSHMPGISTFLSKFSSSIR